MRKGIILAGGEGSRLKPLTTSVSKQLLPVYNKPMIYYPLTNFMLCGIKEILIITNPQNIDNFKSLLKDGSQWGIKIEYKVQRKPEGIAQAFILAEDFIGRENVALILGDNLFYGESFIDKIKIADERKVGATVFAYPVRDPKRYGVIEFDNNFEAISIEEKPKIPKSNYAITGLYFYDNKVIEYSKKLTPSDRGELEITDVNNYYMNNNELKVEVFGRGIAWLDTGTFESLHDAASLIRTLENRQSLKIGYPEEVAFHKGWIDEIQIKKIAKFHGKSEYGVYLNKLIKDI